MKSNKIARPLSHTSVSYDYSELPYCCGIEANWKKFNPVFDEGENR